MTESLVLKLPVIEGWVVVSPATIDQCADLPSEIFGGEMEKRGLLGWVAETRTHCILPPHGDPDCGAVRFEIAEWPGRAFEEADDLETIRQAMVRTYSELYAGLECVIQTCAFRDFNGRRWLTLVESLIKSSNRIVHLLPIADPPTTLAISLVVPADRAEAYRALVEKVVQSVEVSEQSPPEPRQVQKRLVHHAGNLEEAVAIARSWQSSGHCDWFRGQTAPWPLVPTAARLPKDQIEASIERLRQFQQWVRRTAGLEELTDNEHAFWAVAQHYGEPSFYLDFTDDPEIAGFFAAAGSSLETGHPCCLVAFNSTRFEQYVSGLWSRDAALAVHKRPELICLQVDNLWRLEAQRGRFLLSSVDDIEAVYPHFHWIEFPYSGPSNLERNLIYPANRSALEILLDSFWEDQRRLVENPKRQQSLRAVGAEVFVEEDGGSANVGILRDRDDDWHLSSSWTDEAAGPWLISEPENWSEVAGTAVFSLVLKCGDDLGVLEENLRAQALGILTDRPSLRRRIVQWDLGLPIVRPGREVGPVPSHIDSLIGWLGSMWDGIRSLPYTNEQCARAIARCLCLGLQFPRLTAFVQEEKNLVARIFPDPVQVDLTSIDGGSSRGWISATGLEAALLPGIEPSADLASSPIWANFSRGEQILFCQTDPRKLFEFDRLAELLISEFIPSQAVTRSVRPHLYSPPRLLRFGLP